MRSKATKRDSARDNHMSNTETFMSNTERLAATLAENFRGVTYDKKKESGSAYIPNVGPITFRESANDPAVIIELASPKRFKGTAETAADFIETLIGAWRNSD